MKNEKELLLFIKLLNQFESRIIKYKREVSGSFDSLDVAVYIDDLKEHLTKIENLYKDME